MEVVWLMSQNVTANDSDVVVPVNTAIWDGSDIKIIWRLAGREPIRSFQKSLKMP